MSKAELHFSSFEMMLSSLLLSFTFLRRPNFNNFTICDNHLSLYQVELPPWLPQKIVSATLNEFEDHLFSKIIQMMEKMQNKKKRHLLKASNQSQNISDSEKEHPSFDNIFIEDDSKDVFYKLKAVSQLSKYHCFDLF